MTDDKPSKFKVVQGVIKGLKVKVESERIISEADDVPNNQNGSNLEKEVVKTRQNLGNYIQYRFPKYFNRTVVLIVASLPFFALCIILVASLLKFMKAQKMGSLTKGECGKEYMERETQRYLIAKTYSDGVKKDLATINSMLLLCMFIIFLYLCFEGYAIYSQVIDNVSSAISDNSVNNSYPGKIFISKRFYLLLMVSSVIVVFSLWAASLSAWMDNKQLKHDTNMTNKQFRRKLTGFMTFTLLFCFIFLILFFFLGVRTDFLLLSMVIVGLYVALDKFTISFTNFHNRVIVPYQKYARDLNNYLKDKIKTDSKSSATAIATAEKIKKYLIDKIKRVEPNTTTVPDLKSAKYSEELYSYAMHKDGGTDTFDESGSTSSITIATFKTRIVQLFNANVIDKDESAFKTQIGAVAYSSSTTPPTNVPYATGFYNIRMRELFVDIIYNENQRNGVLMGSNIQTIIDKYNATLINSDAGMVNSLKNTFNATTEYPIYDDQNQSLRIGEFGTKSFYRILQEAHDTGVITNIHTVNDLANIAMLKMTDYDHLSINLNTIDNKLDKVKDTLSYENTVSMYGVIDRLQKVINDYKNANITDSQFGTMLSNLRSVDDSMVTNLDAMMKFMSRSTLLAVVVFMFFIFHKVYMSSYKDAMLLYLPLTLIILIIAVSWYA